MYNYLCYWYVFVPFCITFYLWTPIIRTLHMYLSRRVTILGFVSKPKGVREQTNFWGNLI
jgi:hypothetical protein